MHRVLLFIASLTLIFAVSSTAQQSFIVGAYGGINAAGCVTAGSYDSPGSFRGTAVGLYTGFEIAKNAYLYLAPGYIERGSDLARPVRAAGAGEILYRIRMEYMEYPAGIQYRVPAGTFTFHAYSGLSVAALMSATNYYAGDRFFQINSKGLTNAWNILGQGGLGVACPLSGNVSLGLDARYSRSLTPVSSQGGRDLYANDLALLTSVSVALE